MQNSSSDGDLFPLSWLTQYGYCPRRCSLLARQIVLEKLAANRGFLQRMKCEHPESVAAAAYFGVLPMFIPGTRLTFSGRSRRPPEDPVNAVLSFLYTLLKTIWRPRWRASDWTRQWAFCTRCVPGVRPLRWT